MVVRRSHSKTKRRKNRTCKTQSRRTGRKHKRTRRRRRNKIQRGGQLIWNEDIFFNLDKEIFEDIPEDGTLLQDYRNSIIEYGYLFTSGTSTGTKKGPSVLDNVPNLNPLVLPAGAGAVAGAIALSAPTVLVGAAGMGAAGMAAAPFVVNKVRNMVLHKQCLFVSRSSPGKNRYFTDIDLALPEPGRTDVTIHTGVCYTSNLSRLHELANRSHVILHSTVMNGRNDCIPLSKTNEGQYSLRMIPTRHTSNITKEEGHSTSSLCNISNLKEMTQTLSVSNYHKYRGEFGINDSLNCRRFATDLFSLAGFTN